MKRLLTIVAIGAAIIVCAQNPNDAKAAYLLAEEFYAKSDYASTLKYIDLTEKNLGETNCKVLYLKIITQSELAKQSQNYSSLLQSIGLFENATDYPDFNVEKKLEVSKIKLLTNDLVEKQRINNESNQAKKKAFEKGFEIVQNRYFVDLPILSAYKDLLEEKKEDKFFQKIKTSYDWGNNTFLMTPYESFFKSGYTGLSGVVVKDDIVLGYIYHLFDEWVKPKNSMANENLDEVIRQLKQDFGFDPKVYTKGETTFYSWYWDKKEVYVARRDQLKTELDSRNYLKICLRYLQ